MSSLEVESIQADVQALKGLIVKLIGLVKELDADSSDHASYCMDPSCFRCDVAWGRYDID